MNDYKSALLALEYARLAQTSSTPSRDLGIAHSWKPNSAAQRVKVLREKGFLTPTQGTRPGGSITQKTADILGVRSAGLPPLKLEVNLVASDKRELVYQLRQLIKQVQRPEEDDATA